MPDFDLGNFALMLLSKNPQAQKSPLFGQFQEIMRTGNYQLGEQIAMNICNSYRVTKEEAINRARQYFNI